MYLDVRGGIQQTYCVLCQIWPDMPNSCIHAWCRCLKAKSKCLTWLYTLPPDSLVPAPDPSDTYCPTAALSPPAPLAKVTSLDKFCPSTTAPQRVQFLHQVACSAVVDDTAGSGTLRSGKTAYSSPPFSSNSAACPQCGQGGIFHV